MNHRLIQALLFSFLFYGTATAQTLTPILIGSGGGSVNTGTIHLSFSFGEPIVGTESLATDEVEFLTQGFQQPNVFSAVLPVEWLSFFVSTDGDRNRLDWEVAQTGQEAHFQIERSVDGINFDAIGRREPTIGERVRYQWYDDDFAPRFLFYRIQQVDFDGAITRSPIRTIDRSPDGNERLVHFYPNPTSGFLQWTILNSDLVGSLDWQLFDATGRLVRRLDLVIEPTASINLIALPAGSYFYRILTTTDSENGFIILR